MKSETPLTSATTAAKKIFVVVALFSACVNLLMLAVPIYMLQLFDRVVTTRSEDTLYVLTAIVVVSVLVMALLEMVRGRLGHRIGSWMEKQVAPAVLQVSLSRSLKGGPQEARALRDLSTIRGFLSSQGIFPVFDAPWVPIFLGIVFIMHPLLGWISLGGAVIIFILAVLNELLTRRVLQQSQGAQHQAFTDADAALRNADVIEAMGMLPAYQARWRASLNEALASAGKAADVGGILASFAKFVRLGLQIAVLGLGAYLAMTQAISPGTMIAASIIMARALQPVEQAIQGWKSLVAARTAYGRVKDLLATTPVNDAAMPLPRPKGHLALEGVSFVAPGQTAPIVKLITFEAAPGEAVGLIGPSGAGKTTLVRLIVGSLKPTLGSVRLDGAEMSDWSAADRGQYVGYLPQDIELFTGTVAENIARFQQVEPEAIIEAAMMAGVHDVILKLSDGYQTKIGPAGTNLSGGQRQRIGLARALFGNPALLVLDEPNSNLDAVGEHALVEAIAQMRAKGTTVVMIAQRPQVLAQMDRIVVVREGELAMEGPRDEVLQRLKGLAAKPTVASEGAVNEGSTGYRLKVDGAMGP